METSQLKYCLYARKSSESDERQALSIDSQIKEMHDIAAQFKLKIVAVKRESHSAKASGQRSEYNELIQDIRQGVYNAILTWAPDRISRNAGDLGSVVDLMDQGVLKEIRTPGQAFTNNPNDKFLLMILCSQAKLENDNRAKNVLRGMKNKCEMGWRPCRGPLGYLNEKYGDRGTLKIYIDPVRAPMIREMFEKCAYEGMSGRDLMAWANEERHLRTRDDKKITLSMVYNILSNTFYYGEFKYPLKSGKLYEGAHEPLITRELFNKVRERMAAPEKAPYGEKRFAYVGSLVCGHCGHNITASEKIKARKDGSHMRRYVYYHCTNQNKPKGDRCRSHYLREDRLTEQILENLEKVKLDEKRLTKKITHEIQRFNLMQAAVLGTKQEEKTEAPKADLTSYLRFVLTSGTAEEIREVMRYVEEKLVMKEGRLSWGITETV
jgi:DNA invertase Pin-like site-specific DNA recombinase